MIWTRILTAAFALSTAPMALADLTPVVPPPGVLPSDPAQMGAIRNRHSSLVRRAERRCAHDVGWNGGTSYRACVVGSVENAVMLSEDPQLQAYHRSLPFPIRYQWRDQVPAPWEMR